MTVFINVKSMFLLIFFQKFTDLQIYHFHQYVYSYFRIFVHHIWDTNQNISFEGFVTEVNKYCVVLASIFQNVINSKNTELVSFH